MAFPALAEAQGKLEDRQKQLDTIFDEAGADLDMSKVTSVKGTTAEKAAEIKKLNDEMTDLGKEVDAFLAVEAAAERSRKAREQGRPDPGSEDGDGQGKNRGRQHEAKSFGELFTESEACTGKKGNIGPEARLDIELKTLLSTSAGWGPETTRGGRVVEFATRPLQVIDLIPQTTTSQSAVVYMEETTYTNNAAEIAEGGTYPESALALTEQTAPVRKIGTWLPVTDEQLEDVPQVQGYINNRLPFMVRQRLDSQLLVGNGTAPNLLGALNMGPGLQTQAKGSDPAPDAIYKAMTKVRVNGRATPGGVVMHPTNWQDIKLLRTADGIYIWGSPSEAAPDRIWGQAVALADGITLGTAILGDWQMHSELAVRRGIDVQVSNSHGTFFIEGKQAIRADMRAAVIFYRKSAFCTVTGLGTGA